MTFKLIKRRLKFMIEPIASSITNKHQKNALVYARFSRKKINEKTIFFEAYLGQSMTGNSFALFKSLYHDPRFKDYTFIWSINSKHLIQPDFRAKSNVKFVTRNSKEYAKDLAMSKFLITDTTFPNYFNKRQGEQQYIMAWHGTPYKTIGKDIVHANEGAHRNVMKNILHTDYFISPSKFTTETILKSQDADKLFSGTVIETGMPRTDLMFNNDSYELKKKWDLPTDKKIVLYAPTWNDFIKNAKITGNSLAKDCMDLQKQLGDNYLVCLKPHYLEYNVIKDMDTPVRLIDNSIDTNLLLTIVDHLVTDYSSIFFDFLSLNKPIHFFYKNYEEFSQGRGLYLEPSDLPGNQSTTINQLADDIESTNAKGINYTQALKRFSPYDDGNVSERIKETIFFSQSLSIGEAYQSLALKKRLLFYSGFFKNNGISESFIRMSNNLDYDKYDITVIIPTNLKKAPDALPLIQRLNSNITCLYPVGTRVNTTILDKYAYKLFLNRGLNGVVKKLNIPRIFNNEYRRLVGNTDFDTAVDFSGYSAHFGSLIAFGQSTHTAIFLHSDMMKDKERIVGKKRPNKLSLQALFSIYDQFDKLVSVSETSFLSNVSKIGDPLGLSTKMSFVLNYLDGNRINYLKEDFTTLSINDKTFLTPSLPLEFNKQALSIPAIVQPDPNKTNYVTLGRLSPEKNQALLIQSFALALKEDPNSMLYIIGSGPQKNKLVNLATTLGITEKVVFVGHLANPFFLLKQCDIFVLTSLYEGQALVILEALTVGLKVISTDIPGPDNILKEGYGELVEATEIGLSTKMLAVAKKQDTYKKFDAENYDKEALTMFEEMLESF